ncbi:hypothetical protein [uncultured Metabacillus sp.]|uniref:hypothetical protein n=1 Tax=uncultured Metabacillus sp. TaxID=2860135 RepID=UPI00261B99C5|nr:hypothetical protein [uncultured Metabacillus sp.]
MTDAFKKNRRPRGYFNNKENIIKEIARRYENGLKLNNKTMRNEDSGLMTAAIKHFNSWENAIRIAECDYSEIQESQKWTKDIVAASLIDRQLKGLALNPSVLKNNDHSLYKACLNHFGSIKSAIEFSGLNYEDTKQNHSWSKEKVINNLLKRYQNGLSMSVKSISLENPSLYSASKRFFKCYKNALLNCGLTYDDVGERKDWNKDKVIIELKKRFKSGKPMSVDILSSEDSSLLNACIRYFNTYKEAIEACELNYEDIREDTELSRIYGFKFEELLRSILQELKLTHTKGFNKEIRPDIVLKNNQWMDAKLSEHTIFNCKTIEKYEPHCSLLTIVYLRGNKNRVQMLTNKTKIMSVYNLIKQIPKGERQYYTLLADNLWSEANKHIEFKPILN